MRICHVTSAHNSDDPRIFYKECVSLAKDSSNDVFLVARGDSRFERNVHVVGIDNPSGGRLRRMLFFSKRVYKKAIEVNADCYHLHDPELLIYAKRIKKKGKKVIFDSHEYYTEQIKEKKYMPLFLRVIIAKLYYLYETHVARKIDAVIFPCTIEGKHPFFGRANNIEFIRNVPILDDYPTTVDYAKKQVYSVCYAGGLTQDRGLEVIIDACYEVGAKVILAGEIVPREFAQYIMNKESFAAVDFRGRCSHEEVIGIYEEAMIGASTLLPVGQYPKVETLPTKVYEYMAMGMPFIMSDFDYCREFNSKYNCCLLVDTTDVSSVTKALKFLIDNPKEAKALGKKGRIIVEKHYNWSVEENKLFRLYDLINGNI